MPLSPEHDATRDALAAIIAQAVSREGLTLQAVYFRDRNVDLTAPQVLAREILERFDAMMLMSSCAFGSGEE